MTAQQRFDEKYITSTEMMTTLGISRNSISVARRAGKLKDPIVLLGGLVILYERDSVTEYLKSWKQVLEARRNG
jgi:hypothetical protein